MGNFTIRLFTTLFFPYFSRPAKTACIIKCYTITLGCDCDWQIRCSLRQHRFVVALSYCRLLSARSR
uniref:Putative secreted protein n=1 Tax=Anopheles triannulatus TaxID=58253 RepID=A0A2M4B184_9DIPT